MDVDRTDVDRRPICVDLEDALLRREPLDEALLALVKQRPALLLQLPCWAMGGRAALAAEVRRRMPTGGDWLPLDEDLMEWLRAAHAEGRALALYSSLAPDVVERLGRRLRIFGEVRGGLAKDGRRAAAHAAHGEALVYLDGATMRQPAHPRPTGWSALRLWRRALRIHQWAKNTLVFVPVALAGPLATPDEWLAAGLAFLTLGLLASAGYLINDLLDLEADRLHGTKQRRPFAAGELPVRDGLLAIPCLVLPAAAICLVLPGPFVAVAAAYLALSLTYSLWLKRMPVLDVIVLAGLFTMRVLGGAMLLAKPMPYWLLTFAMFLFLSLATIKRVTELKAMDGVPQLRGYIAADLAMLMPLGLACAVAANVIFVIYVVNEHVPSDVYRQPYWLWLILPVLLFWILRLWRIAVHGEMHEDPVLYAIRDRTSLLLGGMVLVLLALAW
jgi:4-hydroxybenzoate polyprenyltransferase